MLIICSWKIINKLQSTWSKICSGLGKKCDTEFPNYSAISVSSTIITAKSSIK